MVVLIYFPSGLWLFREKFSKKIDSYLLHKCYALLRDVWSLWLKSIQCSLQKFRFLFREISLQSKSGDTHLSLEPMFVLFCVNECYHWILFVQNKVFTELFLFISIPVLEIQTPVARVLPVFKMILIPIYGHQNTSFPINLSTGGIIEKTGNDLVPGWSVLDRVTVVLKVSISRQNV